MPVEDKEKRQDKRVALRLAIRYRNLLESTLQTSVTRDISLNGLRMLSENFLPPLTKILVEINFFAQIINLSADVVWSQRIRYSDKYETGIRFLEFDPAKRRYLQDYLQLVTYQNNI